MAGVTYFPPKLEFGPRRLNRDPTTFDWETGRRRPETSPDTDPAERQGSDQVSAERQGSDQVSGFFEQERQGSDQVSGFFEHDHRRQGSHLYRHSAPQSNSKEISFAMRVIVALCCRNRVTLARGGRRPDVRLTASASPQPESSRTEEKVTQSAKILWKRRRARDLSVGPTTDCPTHAIGRLAVPDDGRHSDGDRRF